MGVGDWCMMVDCWQLNKSFACLQCVSALYSIDVDDNDDKDSEKVKVNASEFKT